MMKRLRGIIGLWEDRKLLNRGLGILLLSLVCWGCGEDPQQLFETAQFEEQQNNRAHARQLYERIIQEFPESSVALNAKKRLEEWEREKAAGSVK